LEFNKRLVKSYTSIFRSTDDDEGNESDFSQRTQFAKQWGWYQSLYAIAEGQLERFRNVTKLPLHDCLTWLTFEKQKRDIEHSEMQRELNKIK
jgi:hypothetical protein